MRGEGLGWRDSVTQRFERPAATWVGGAWEPGSVSSGIYEGSLSMEGTPGSWKTRRSRASTKAILGGLVGCRREGEGFPTDRQRGGDRGAKGHSAGSPWVQ